MVLITLLYAAVNSAVSARAHLKGEQHKEEATCVSVVQEGGEEVGWEHADRYSLQRQQIRGELRLV